MGDYKIKITKNVYDVNGGSVDTIFEETETDVKHEVVAIYDNAGIPSFMHRFKKITNKELFGGSDKTHGAFIIDGEEYDEIYISVYENCEINGKPYSLPYMEPWTDITNDDAAMACFSKGEGWHLLTAAEWGLLANISLKNGTLQAPKNNDAALDIDLEKYGCCWLNVTDDAGETVRVSVYNDKSIPVMTNKHIAYGCKGCAWIDVRIECESEKLKELALYAGEPGAYFYANSTEGEYFPLRGGGWHNGAGAGVFYTCLTDSRSNINSYIGFRSAYFKKHRKPITVKLTGRR